MKSQRLAYVTVPLPCTKPTRAILKLSPGSEVKRRLLNTRTPKLTLHTRGEMTATVRLKADSHRP
jgi:hypothetical protein